MLVINGLLNWNVRDLGGHLDVTGRARATTLGCTVSWVLFGRLRLLGTLHVPGAVHGAEAAVVSQDALRKLRVAFVRAVWSDGLNLASPCAVINLLDGPVGCDPGIMWHGVGFGCCVGTWRITQRFMSAAESMGCFGSSLPVRLVLSHSSSALKCCLFRGFLASWFMYLAAAWIAQSLSDFQYFLVLQVFDPGDISSRAWVSGLPLS